MTDQPPSRRRRPRLDSGARQSLLEEIARIAAQNPVGGDQPASGNLPRVTNIWGNLLTIPVNEAELNRNLVITAARQNAAHAAFDVLRTRLLQALADNGWKRVAITSPTKGCGKSFTAVNLAITLSRYDKCRTVLMDMDLRHPSIARYLTVSNPPAMGDYLKGSLSTEVFLRKPGQNMLHIGDNMAVGLNGRTEAYAAELFHDPMTAEVLTRMRHELQPDIVLFDLPPALAQDDVIAFRPHFDCVLLVVGGGITTARQMKETVRRIGEDKPVVGVILNKAEGDDLEDYYY